MPTGDKRANIYNKRNMPQEAWDLHFFRFLDDKINDTTQAAFLQSGILGDETIGLTGPFPGQDVFGLDLTLEDRVMDGFGHIIDLGVYASLFGSPITAYFENALGVDYYVGIRYQEKPDDVERNPRSSEPEYPWFQDTIGEKGTPDNVTDNGTYIRLEIDGILENGVDHSRGPAIVWLNNPVSPDDSIAYYTGTVGYAAGINYVDIPYSPSQGPLGQTAPEFTISLDALDYQVLIPGVSWFRNTDISTDNNYAFIGKVIGAGAGTAPTVFDISGQRPVFLISLDRAYRANSPDDPAPGRTIFADKEAVRFKQSATVSGAEDSINEAFRIDQLSQGGAFFSKGATVLSGYHGGAGLSGGWSHYLSLTDGTGGDLEATEAFTGLSGTATVQLTRVGVDLLTKFTPWFTGDGILCKITGTTGGALDGWYYASGSGVTVNTFDIMNADFSPVVFPAGTGGNIQIVAPLVGSFQPDWIGSGSYGDLGAHFFGFPAWANGFSINAYGEIVDPGRTKYIQFTNRDDSGNQNSWGEFYAGRFRLMGGGIKGSYTRTGQTDTIGHAQWTSDKLTGNFGSDWTPAETRTEWGFDYRGAHWGKTGADIPPFQLGFTYRIPLWDSSGDFEFEEDFIYYTGADTLEFTRVGFDNTNMPFQVSSNPNTVLCEIEVDAPFEYNSGVYFATQKVSTNRIRFEKVDGTVPIFNPGITGKCRFYGGVFQGAINNDSFVGSSDAFLVNLLSPQKRMGGIRYAHHTDDLIGSTDWNFAAWFTNVDEPMFAIRDGGVTFARALTTKSPFTLGNLVQWDQIDTSLYTGDLAKIDVLSVIGGTRKIEVEGAFPGNFIYPQSGPITGTNRAQSLVAGHASFTHASFTSAWKINTSDNRGIECTVTTGQREYWQFPLDLPDGVTLEGVFIRGKPMVGLNSSASMGFAVYRQSHMSGSSATLLGGPAVRWSGGDGVTQTPFYNCTVDNTIYNGSYDYFVKLESSSPTGATGTDRVYWASSVMDVTALGNCLLYGR